MPPRSPGINAGVNGAASDRTAARWRWRWSGERRADLGFELVLRDSD
ncbi:hypothetical protein [Bradyrhizobium genosp. P]